ncbi:hypothetical protein [Streptomyces sp. SID13726]|uniref:hypothetical protein n=1 Tax=Streptomyces sp. SID13726 TaxID=2706058 RepID=UPI0013BC4A13|nr:hypothetical protein [Streptomyces sp. SID13726]NEB00880.1 hypothetical protein [Streptomyces sp. SID13726]
MKALHRAPLLALLAVTSCGIPATGVVEAGAPASGSLPLTQVYFVGGGGLVAMPRNTDRPGDPEAALRLLMAGPLAGEEASGRRISTEVPALPTAMAVPSAATDEDGNTPPDTPAVTVKGDAMTIRLPPGIDALSDLGVRQMVCTAASAYRLTHPSDTPVGAEVTGGGSWRVTASDEGCPVR